MVVCQVNSSCATAIFLACFAPCLVTCPPTISTSGTSLGLASPVALAILGFQDCNSGRGIAVPCKHATHKNVVLEPPRAHPGARAPPPGVFIKTRFGRRSVSVALFNRAPATPKSVCAQVLLVSLNLFLMAIQLSHISTMALEVPAASVANAWQT